MKAGAVVALVLLSFSPALAGQAPACDPDDRRICHFHYDPKKPDQIWTIWTAPEATMAIEIRDPVQEELIINVSGSDSDTIKTEIHGKSFSLRAGGCVVPEPLFVTVQFPSALSAGQHPTRIYRFQFSTTPPVCQDKPPETRIVKYASDDGVNAQGLPNLQLLPRYDMLAGPNANIMYSVIIDSTPDPDPSAKPARMSKAERARVRQQEALKTIEASESLGAGEDHCRYGQRGDANLRPWRVCSNGRDTTIYYRSQQPVPLVLRIDAGGQPNLVSNLPVKQVPGGFAVVVPGVSYRWLLQGDGNTALELVNCQYSCRPFTPAASLPPTRTNSPSAERYLKAEAP